MRSVKKFIMVNNFLYQIKKAGVRKRSNPSFLLEATSRLEPGNNGFANRNFTKAKKKGREKYLTRRFYWRRHPDLNRGITVLQTAALATWLCRRYENKNGAGERI
jgi:hypothetical protein